MKRPDVFALNIMSPCCMSAREAPPAKLLTRLEGLQTREQATGLGFLERATLATAAAWSPNANKPPFFLDLPTGEGPARAAILAKWNANAPLAMVQQYVFNLRRYAGIAIDVGDQDGLRVDAAELHRLLTSPMSRIALRSIRAITSAEVAGGSKPGHTLFRAEVVVRSQLTEITKKNWRLRLRQPPIRVFRKGHNSDNLADPAEARKA